MSEQTPPSESPAERDRIHLRISPDMGQPQGKREEDTPPDIRDMIRESVTLNPNLRQEIVLVTRDRLQLCVGRFTGEYRSFQDARDSWKAPLGILVTLAPMLITITFLDAPPFGVAFWKGIYWAASVVVAGWLLRAVWSRYRTQRGPDTDDLVRAITQPENG